MKKNLTRVMAMGMAFAMTGTATVFAEEISKGLPLANEVKELPAEPADAAELPAGEEFAWKDYITQTGKISSIGEEDEKGVRVVTIDNEQGGLRFAVDSMTPVLDRAESSIIPAGGLKEGMEAAVVYEANSPMGMSMPPYLGKVTAVVANADKGFYMAGHFDGDLTDAENSLKLNIAEETSIINTLGTRQAMTAEDIKGQDAIVFYDVTTRSIPAQTTPSLVMVLAAAPEDTAAEPEETAPEKEAGDEGPAFVPLRKTAEAMGWKVTWQGKGQPVLMEKEGVSVAVTAGEADYIVDGDMVKQAQLAAELRDGVLFVSYEVFAE